MVSKDIYLKIRKYPFKILIREGLKEVWRIVRHRAFRETYSQAGEDRAIVRCLLRMGEVPKQGLYVDVGANDPIHFNNTYLLYRKGWRGINIEPIRSYVRKLDEVRPEDCNLNCGVWSDDHEREFFELWPGNQSTFLKESVEKAKGYGARLVESYLLPVRSLDSILQKEGVPRIDVLSVDAEGAEEEILQGFDIDKYRPSIICIETTNCGQGIGMVLQEAGYECAWQGELSSVWCDNVKCKEHRSDH